jgi:DNA replication and repair protein RecF
LFLLRLKLTNFKNYEALAVQLSPRLNCFTGLNGMGKTNLLDAIYFLCLCKSHTGLPDKNLVRHGETFFRLEGHFEQLTGEHDKVVAKFLTGQRKEIEHNDNGVTRLTDFIGQFPVVMIAPDDVSLVQEGSEERRRFLDTTLSQLYPDYLGQLLVYNALLKQRNALLKQFADTHQFDSALLEAIDRQMPGPARLLYERRTAFVQAFEPLFTDLYAVISGSREQVSVAYQSDLARKPLAELFDEARDKDRMLQRTTAGPHRDDLELKMDGQIVKKFASQGQLKSFLLAMRLAQYELLRQEKGISPLLLLDDIFDKLDEQRVRQLIALLIDRAYGQIFITDTQRSRMESVVGSFEGDYAMFEVSDGAVNNHPSQAS